MIMLYASAAGVLLWLAYETVQAARCLRHPGGRDFERSPVRARR